MLSPETIQAIQDEAERYQSQVGSIYTHYDNRPAFAAGCTLYAEQLEEVKKGIIDFGVFIYSLNCEKKVEEIDRRQIEKDYEKFTQSK